MENGDGEGEKHGTGGRKGLKRGDEADEEEGEGDVRAEGGQLWGARDDGGGESR